MINAVFTEKDGRLTGFTLTGHSSLAEHGQDIVCAGVSSALMLTINTITDFIKADAEVDADPDKEGYASLRLCEPYNERAQDMISSFYAHLGVIKEEYGQIKLSITKSS